MAREMVEPQSFKALPMALKLEAETGSAFLTCELPQVPFSIHTASIASDSLLSPAYPRSIC